MLNSRVIGRAAGRIIGMVGASPLGATGHPQPRMGTISSISGTGRELWARGDSFEWYVGRWSRLVAVGFLAWLNVQPGGALAGCGLRYGALSAAILARCEPAQVVGVAPSEGYIAWGS